MVLAEALLRVPDARTADQFIEDRLGEGDFLHHETKSSAFLVNASAWALGVSARVIQPGETPQGTIGRLAKRLGEPAVRAVTRAMLAQRGHRVTVAENAHEALRLWREHDGDFDLLVTDMVMPGMTGLELIETIRKEKPELKAILCSGYSLDIALARSAGSVEQVALLQKPWKAEALHRSVAQMLGGNESERSP